MAYDDEQKRQAMAALQTMANTLELKAGSLTGKIDEFLEMEPSNADMDAFSAFLRDRDLITAEEYRRVNASGELSLNEPVLTALPARSDRYKLLGAVGQGGMAEIRVARDRVLDRKVAIKLLHAHRTASQQVISRFVREAQITGKLDHPNIVPVYGLQSETDGRLSFTMKLVQGENLQDLIAAAAEAAQKGEPIDEDFRLSRRLEIFIRVCEAMSYAHKRGVIHRDLKPANLMVGEFGEVYVMDWGIAKLIEMPDDPGEDDDAWHDTLRANPEMYVGMTSAGAVVGTPAYMSPEQVDGVPLDARSDLYTLGAILFELVTLIRMTPGTTVTDVLRNVVHRHRNPVQHLLPGTRIDNELRAIVERAVDPNRETRYQSVVELADDLRRYLADEETTALPDNALRKLTRIMSRHRDATLALMATIILVAGGATSWSLWQENRAVQESRIREKKVNAFHASVVRKAHAIDAQFVRFELLTKQLSDSASYLLSQPAPSTPPRLYSNHNFDGSGPPPVDLADAPLYGKRVSLDHPVYKLAPGVDLADVQEQLDRLSPLRRTMTRVFLESRVERVAVDEAATRKLLTRTGVPARWAYIGTASGVMFSYPGKGGYPPEYDPRKRPWYELGQKVDDATWGAPYPDLQGQGVVLPCVTTVRDAEGKMLGVAGLEVTADFLIERYMKPEGAVTNTYLLDSKGRVIVASDQAGAKYAAGVVQGAIELEPYEIPEVVTALGAGQSGHVEVGPPNAVELVAFYQIPTLGWGYVERAPLDAVVAGE